MDTSRFASTFAPYAPPPDEPPAPEASSSTHPPGFPRLKRPWFAQGPSQGGASYQSGGVPTFGNSLSGGLGAAEEGELQTVTQMWETRFGWRVDVCAAVAYLGGPATALFFLILETSNDFIRFHAYQSALLTTSLFVFRILASFIFPYWLQTILTLIIVVAETGMAVRAYRDGSVDLFRYELPYIGEVAERWVGEE